MIPIFPNFIETTEESRKQVMAMGNPSRPYSSFNFTNFLAWDVKGTRKISVLNDNLIFLFTDYVTNEVFLSFSGAKKPVHTVKELLKYAESNNFSTTLRFIPEEVAKLLNSSDLSIEEDFSAHDYIYSTEKLFELKGSSYKSKRLLVQNFEKKYKDVVFSAISLSSKSLHDDIHRLLKKWIRNKVLQKKEFDVSCEGKALQRLLSVDNNKTLIFSTAKVDNKIIGFSIDEVLENGFSMAHFIKGDISYRGVYEYLNQKIAGFLLERNINFWNWQQDLSIDGLRKLKVSYRPVDMFKKFKVTLKNITE